MARGVNKVILIGNLGRDPETRYTPHGVAVTTVTIATSDVWKDKQTGEQQERTEWHRVVFFSRLAEIAAEYLKKGSRVYVEGSLRTNKWQDKTGQDRYTTEIIANEMQLLDSRSGSSATPPPDAYDTLPPPTGRSFPDTAPARSSSPSGIPPTPLSSYDDALPPIRTPTAPNRPRPPADPTPKTDDNFEDDIPF